MDEGFKRLVEIFIIIAVLFFSIYFLLYKFYFEEMCHKYSSYYSNKNIQFSLLAKCKDSIVCEISDKEYNKNIMVSWECYKKRKDYFEIDFYLNKYDNLKTKWKQN